MLVWLLAVDVARALEICPGCSVRDAVEAVGAGEIVEIRIPAGNYSESSPIVVPPNATVHLVALGAVTLTNTAFGSVIVVSYPGATLTADALTLTAVADRVFDVTAGRVEVYDSVLYTLGVVDEGGSVYVGPGASFYARDALFLDNTATATGGHLLAREGDVELVNCRFRGGYARRGGALAFEGGVSPASVLISGGTFEQNLAAEGGGAIALTGAVELTIQGAIFEGNAADLGGAIADYGLEHANASVLIEGSHFENNTADLVGGAIAIESAVYTLRDTTLSNNSANTGGALWIGGGFAGMERNMLCENTARVGGAVATATPLPQIWFNNRLIENVAESGGAVDHTGGLLELRHANLLGNSAAVGGAVRSDSAVLVRDSLIGWTEGSTALVAVQVQENWNSFWENVAGDVQESDADDVLFDNDVRSDPRLERYLPGSGCDAVDDFYNWYGPLRSGGDPLDAPNPDGSEPPDIGAFGGQFAPSDRWLDRDFDTYPPLYDCVEGNDDIHPEAREDAYDGIDANCDGADDFDADGDGFRPPVDCNDTDPNTYPGAIELPDHGDQNCDGKADADGDGFAASEDCDDTNDRIHPGALEDPGPRDLDCSDPFDVPRPLQPRSCAVLPHSVGSQGIFLSALALVALWVRRREAKTRR